MTANLVKAVMTPYDTTGRTAQTQESIVFDFNPESLRLQVESGNERDRSRRGRQQVQHVGHSKATLTFDAVFDSTRPKPEQTGTRSARELDVRRKTSAIAALMEAQGGGRHPSPRRVNFAWGTVNFDGILQSFQETLDFFSPDGVPLRSRVSVGLVEQDFRYTVPAAAAAQGPAGAAPVTSAPVAPGLPGGPFGAPGSLSLGLGANLDLGLDVDLGFSAGAGISLSADLSVSVFGGAAVTAALGVDLDLRAGFSASGTATASSGFQASVSGNPTAGASGTDRFGSAALPAGSWAQGGPKPGSAAHEAAKEVEMARAQGEADSRSSATAGSFVAALPPGGTSIPGATASGTYVPANGGNAGKGLKSQPTMLPVQGMSPRKPLAVARDIRNPVFAEKDFVSPLRRDDPGRRPSWERSAEAPPPAPRLVYDRAAGGDLDGKDPFRKLGPGRPDPCFEQTRSIEADGTDCGCGG